MSGTFLAGRIRRLTAEPALGQDDIRSQEANSGTGAVVRSLAQEMGVLPIVASRFGLSSVAANNRDPLSNACIQAQALGNPIISIPRGTFKIVPAIGITLRAGQILRGAGPSNTVLQFDMTGLGTTDRLAFYATANSITLEDLSIEVVSSDVGVKHSLSLFQVSGEDLTFRRVYVRGGMINLGDGTTNWTTHWCRFSGASKGILIENCRADRFGAVMLKTNTQTFETSQIRVLNSQFSNQFLPPGVNSPSGIADDILWLGCRFSESQSTQLGYRILSGGASQKNARYIGGVYNGTGTDAIHIEEAARRLIIANNTGEFSSVQGEGEVAGFSAGAAIKVLDNNVGGSSHTPTTVNILGNVFEGPDSARSFGCGLSFAYDASGQAAGDHVVVANNVFRRYRVGYQMDLRVDRGLVVSGLAEDCGIGWQIVRASPGYSQVAASNCDVGIQVEAGGVLGFAVLNGCAVPFRCPVGRPSWDLAGWALSTPRVTIPSGSATVTQTVIPLNLALASGDLFVTLQPQGSTILQGARRRYTITKDSSGTTLTPVGSAPAGAASSVSLSVSGSNLVVELGRTGSEAVDVSATVRFDGLWTVLPDLV